MGKIKYKKLFDDNKVGFGEGYKRIIKLDSGEEIPVATERQDEEFWNVTDIESGLLIVCGADYYNPCIFEIPNKTEKDALEFAKAKIEKYLKGSKFDTFAEMRKERLKREQK